MASDSQFKASLISERQSNLPKPEPAGKSDFNSLSTGINSTTNEQANEINERSSKGQGLSDQAFPDEVNGEIGREGKDGLQGPPKDAAA